MFFNFFKKKKAEPRAILDFSFKEEFENMYSYLCENHKEDFEEAKKRFVELTGQFDDEHEYFNSKMDDFRHWFVFFYKFKNELFYTLKKIKSEPGLEKFFLPLSEGVFSIFQITEVKQNSITLKDMIQKNKFTVSDSVYFMSLSEGDLVQTAVFETGKNEFSFGISMIHHPAGTKSFIQKKVKQIYKEHNTKTDSDADLKVKIFELLNSLLLMRYQLFKYKQVKVSQIYNDTPLTKKTSSGEL